MPPRLRAAVCLLGRIQGLASNAASLADRLLRPLRADLFVYAPSGFIREASQADLGALHSLPGLVRLVQEEEDVSAQLRSELEHHVQNSGTQVSPGEVLALMEMVEGNWIGGYRGRDGAVRRGTGLNQMYSLRWCLQMVEQHEAAAEASRGQAWSYDWIIKSRLDNVWEVQHLPLQLFSKEFIWIPEGHDWGGLNDRHALVPRSPSSRRALQGPSQVYFNGWSWLTTTKAVGTIQDAFWNVNMCEDRNRFSAPCLNHESWLWARLGVTHLPVSRFPNTAWSLCGNKSDLRWEGTQHNLEECQRARRPYRYRFEHANAQAMGRCLTSAASSGAPGSLEPPGLEETPHGSQDLDEATLASILARVQSCWKCADSEKLILSATYPREWFALCSMQLGITPQSA